MKDKKYVVFGNKSWIQNNKGEVLTTKDKHLNIFDLRKNGNKDISLYVLNKINNNIMRF